MATWDVPKSFLIIIEFAVEPVLIEYIDCLPVFSATYALFTEPPVLSY
jgi:hypothetical protein